MQLSHDGDELRLRLLLQLSLSLELGPPQQLPLHCSLLLLELLRADCAEQANEEKRAQADHSSAGVAGDARPPSRLGTRGGDLRRGGHDDWGRAAPPRQPRQPGPLRSVVWHRRRALAGGNLHTAGYHGTTTRPLPSAPSEPPPAPPRVAPLRPPPSPLPSGSPPREL